MGNAASQFIKRYRPQFYIMNAEDNRELLYDKRWRAKMTFLICHSRKGREFILAGAGHGYGHVGDTCTYIYDTGNGHRVPNAGDETFVIDGIIGFDAEGDEVGPMHIENIRFSDYKFYVMK